MDVLSDAIAAMRTGRPHSGRRNKYAPWGMRIEDSDGAGFHALLRGSAWLIPGAGEPVALGPGDVVFLAHGRGYALTSDLDVEPDVVRFGADGRLPEPPAPAPGSTPDTVMLCGAYWLDRTRAHPLLSELPEVVHLPAGSGAHGSLRAAVELLSTELAEPQPGADQIVTSLLDTLLLYILRAWWQGEARGQDHPTGWAAALADPAVTAALQAIHAAPHHPWTVEELATRVGLSRAAFARRFTTLVGRPPLTYLTWWRMTTAGRLLRDDALPLRHVAQRTGYTSEFAFAKAFKREYGVAPGQYRKEAS
ncbi:AraC family transcriptional regulator [Streptomyces sp. S.PB5]|uniref:AraC family transcriptional regulator n=1 Tax=Streptomyces sp. S.PB5 TaxID=3020844 RepID=UPI0025B00F8A|nr:AraC family transcriptional regulator [Streptomyces sp. S.PB5]MDN3024986.1 AraC family transcriptional regulator [Streptomyces sp. S.PB5]